MGFLALAKLTNRALLRISGPDTYAYLQGLICNDLRILYEKQRIVERKHAKNTSNVLSTFMLNAQGRAICDLLIYRTPKTSTSCEFLPPGQATNYDELLIECDQGLATGLANTLYGYRVRRKISLQLEKNLHIWSLFPLMSEESNPTNDKVLIEESKRSLVESIPNEVLTNDIIAVSDPRLMALGMRIISTKDTYDAISSYMKSLINTRLKNSTLSDYVTHRYILGVGEGLKDHPESNCLALECNADELGSVSYSKGCYLGQELTARIHYTGVIRKRLMPIVIEDIDSSHGVLQPVAGADLIDSETEKKVGVIRNVHKNRGLGLIRTDLLTTSQKLIQKDTKTRINTYVPFWWS